MKKQKFKPGDIIEIVDIHPRDSFEHNKSKLIGK